MRANQKSHRRSACRITLLFGISRDVDGLAIELSDELCRFFEPEGMVRAFFSSGGSDAVETALRLARQYWKVRGQRDRTKFIALKRGYHGTHFGGASVNGHATFRRNYEPLLPGCYHIAAPYSYRNPFGETDRAASPNCAPTRSKMRSCFRGRTLSPRSLWNR